MRLPHTVGAANEATRTGDRDVERRSFLTFLGGLAAATVLAASAGPGEAMTVDHAPAHAIDPAAAEAAPEKTYWVWRRRHVYRRYYRRRWYRPRYYYYRPRRYYYYRWW